ncbi:hypothetical protein GCK32_022387 [Trichostrongylus colubriformis]|uniref:EGF-like domain-containing protein n=1 Tax=Trichostrongylus colubriformis TaxID=6319 RepID=A0AAN8EZI2_TRICO
MVLKLAIIFLSVLELLAITDGSIRSDPVIIASIINCDPIGTWMRHRHRCICRPYFHGLRCNRIHRCVSGKPRNVRLVAVENRLIAVAKLLPRTFFGFIFPGTLA